MTLGTDEIYIASNNTVPGIVSIVPALGATSPNAVIDNIASQLGTNTKICTSALGVDYFFHLTDSLVTIKDSSGVTITSLPLFGAGSKYYLISISENKQVFAIMQWFSTASNNSGDPNVRVSVFDTNTLVWNHFTHQGDFSYNTADHRYFHVSLSSTGSKITFSYRVEGSYIQYFKMLDTSDMSTSVLPAAISASTCKDMVIWMNGDDDLLLSPVGGGTASIYNYTLDSLTGIALSLGDMYKPTSSIRELISYSPDSSEISIVRGTVPYFGLLDVANLTISLPVSRSDQNQSTSHIITDIKYFKDMIVTSISGYPGVCVYKQNPDGDWEQSAIVQIPASNGVLLAQESPVYGFKVDGTITESLVASNWTAIAYNVVSGLYAGLSRFTGATFTVELITNDPVYITVTADQGDIWVANNTYPLDELAFPTDPTSTPYYYKVTTAGISGASEPIWGTVPASTVNDGTVIWTYVERIIQPATQGPIIPVVV